MVLAVTSMVLLHLFADFTLQGCLANLKQRSWWIEEGKKQGMTMQEIAKYKHDYKCGMLCHALYWSLITFAPIVLFEVFNPAIRVLTVVINTAIHYWVDDKKANQRTITLWEDQAYHLLQIVVTWSIVYGLLPVVTAI